jgi:hypothetical protein
MSETPTIPIACDLSALSPGERDRRRGLAGAFGRIVIGRTEIPDGFRFELDPARLDLQGLAEWISLERRCCPFLHFGIDLEPLGGVVTVTLSGQSGVKEFLRAELKV